MSRNNHQHDGDGRGVRARIHEALFRELKAPVQRVASKDSPVSFAKQLEAAFFYSRAEIERPCARL